MLIRRYKKTASASLKAGFFRSLCACVLLPCATVSWALEPVSPVEPSAVSPAVSPAITLSENTNMVALDDESMGEVTGDGLNFVWEDFRIMFDPQSYIEQQGSPSNNTCTATGNNAGNFNCTRRGDLRWYGASVSSTGGATGNGSSPTTGVWATTWITDGANMGQCAGAGINGLGCPRGGPINLFAAHDNPYILRVADIAGDNSVANSIGNGVATYEGNTSSADWNSGLGGSAQTTLEWLAPTAQDYYRLAFWGEIEVGRGGTGTGLLKSQTIIQGNAAGSKLRFFKFTQETTSPGLQQPYNPVLGAAGCDDSGCADVDGAGSTYSNRSVGIQYESYMRGDMRFSTAQTAADSGIGMPEEFHETEGLYFRNAEVYVPVGQPFYQALTLNVPRDPSTNNYVTDGNFVLEVPILPNRTAVFTRFYSISNHSGAPAPNSYDDGYATARSAILYSLPVTGAGPAYMPARTAATVPGYLVPDNNYYSTHGYVHWGDWFICQGVGCRLPLSPNTGAQADAGIGRNAWNSDGDGVFFVGRTAYNAYAYRTNAVDVRAGNNQYTSITYYNNYGACTPAGSTSYTQCGYGGAYRGAGGGSVAKSVASVSIQPAERSWTNQAASGMGGNANRNVIQVPAGEALNIGDSRIEGIQINHLRFTTTGAQL